jgi:hypothetical protein
VPEAPVEAHTRGRRGEHGQSVDERIAIKTSEDANVGTEVRAGTRRTSDLTRDVRPYVVQSGVGTRWNSTLMLALDRLNSAPTALVTQCQLA